jgi:hypothetical protein
MAIAVAPLTVYQGGPETTPGTAVAATRKFALESLDITATDSVYRPQITNGILLDNPGGETINSRGATWVARGPVVYNELHRWASMVVGTLVTTGGASPYTHTFTKLATANPTLKSWTLERRISDGSTHLDTEWPYSLGSSLTLTAELDAPIMMEVNGFSRAAASSTLTAALTQVTVGIPPAVTSKVYIDPAYASLGSTQISGQVLRWDVTFRSGNVAINTMDGRTTLDMGTHAVNGREAGLDMNIRMMVKADSGQYAAERTAAQAQSLRAVRLEVIGSATAEVEIDALVKHVSGDVTMVSEENGYVVFDMALVSATDLTNAYVMKVINAEATL